MCYLTLTNKRIHSPFASFHFLFFSYFGFCYHFISSSNCVYVPINCFFVHPKYQIPIAKNLIFESFEACKDIQFIYFHFFLSSFLLLCRFKNHSKSIKMYFIEANRNENSTKNMTLKKKCFYRGFGLILLAFVCVYFQFL